MAKNDLTVLWHDQSISKNLITIRKDKNAEAGHGLASVYYHPGGINK